MKVIGITGGIGAGKTAALEYLEIKPGIKLLLADLIARDLMGPGTECLEKIRKVFPKQVFCEDGQIQKEKMAELIFAKEGYRSRINSIVHPEVKAFIKKEIEEIRRKKEISFFFIESALLLEEHYDEICDEMWYIYTDEAKRKQRLQESRRYSEKKIQQIFESQSTEVEFRERCEIVIDNNGTLDETYCQIEKALKSKGDSKDGNR